MVKAFVKYMPGIYKLRVQAFYRHKGRIDHTAVILCSIGLKIGFGARNDLAYLHERVGPQPSFNVLQFFKNAVTIGHF